MIAWRRLLGLWDNEQAGGRKLPDLAVVTEQARRDWIYAQHYYKTVTDPDLIDYAAFLIKAYERRYVYLLKKARREDFRYPAGAGMPGIMDEGTIRQVL